MELFYTEIINNLFCKIAHGCVMVVRSSAPPMLFLAVRGCSFRPDAISMQTAHQLEWQDGCELLRSSISGIGHSAIQGEGMHKGTLIIIMCFIPSLGRLYTWPPAGRWRSWSAAERHHWSCERFGILLKDTTAVPPAPPPDSTAFCWPPAESVWL